MTNLKTRFGGSLFKFKLLLARRHVREREMAVTKVYLTSDWEQISQTLSFSCRLCKVVRTQGDVLLMYFLFGWRDSGRCPARNFS